jgi:hypothetical protein
MKKTRGRQSRATVPLSILLGIPQRSILRPLLFPIYLNDLPTCLKLFSSLFADVTTLLASKTTIEELFSFVSEEFGKVVNYFRAHRLVLHLTVYMLFSISYNANLQHEIYFENNNYSVPLAPT